MAAWKNTKPPYKKLFPHPNEWKRMNESRIASSPPPSMLFSMVEVEPNAAKVFSNQ